MGRMSDIPDTLLHRICDLAPAGRLALLDERANPDALPIVFARVASSFWSPIDGKPKKHGRVARLTRIERNPVVTLVIDHYAVDWRDLWWLRVQAHATVIEGEHTDWDAAVAALNIKYPQYGTTPMFHHDAVMIRLQWERVRWWGADGIAGLERWLERNDP